jgi:hypothetical protein
MRIMAKQLANKEGSITLPNGRHIQAGTETLTELHRVHLPGSTAGETTEQRLGQPNLGKFTAHREDWEQPKMVTDQYKIRSATNTFKPLKSAGTDEIVPAVLHQGVHHLMTHTR